jgi:DNA-3-methyladenine glycosylase II
MEEALEYLSRADPIFNVIIEKYGVPPVPKRSEGVETLVLLILEQQVSIDSAKATFLRLRTRIKIFEPTVLIDLPDEEYRTIGVSRQKTSYIKALSMAVINKDIDLESLASKSVAQVREELIKIKGIGNWTIDVYLMFSLQAPDLLPLGDVAVVTTMKELLDIHDKKDMQAYGKKWSPYRSFATFLLWHYYLKKRNRTIVYQY